MMKLPRIPIALACAAGIAATLGIAAGGPPTDASSGAWTLKEDLGAESGAAAVATQKRLAHLPTASFAGTDALRTRVAAALAPIADRIPASATDDIVAFLAARCGGSNEAYVAWRVARGDAGRGLAELEADLALDAFEAVTGKSPERDAPVSALALPVFTATTALGPTNRIAGFLDAPQCFAASLAAWSAPVSVETPGLSPTDWHGCASVGRAWWVPSRGEPKSFAPETPTVRFSLVVVFEDGWRAPLHCAFVEGRSGRLELAQMSRSLAATVGARWEY